MANRRFTQFFYTLHRKPVLIDCNFIVDSTNGNGLGQRSLKGNGVAQVYMNTSASITGNVATTAAQITTIVQGTSSLLVGMAVQGTGIPAGTVITSIISSSAVGISATPSGNHSSETITYQGIGAPGGTTGPAAGLIYVKLMDNYAKYLGGFSGFVSPVATSTKIDNSALTVGNPYVITTVGNSTLAQWQSIGLPVGIAPAVGAAFIASAVGIAGEANTSTSRVMIPGVSGINSIEVIGDSNQSVNPIGAQIIGNSTGAYLIFQALGATSSSTTTLIPTAPAPGSVIGMSFYLSSYSGLSAGE